ncbi:hypothetical protein LWI28_014850 [Acer negundo]|uniref:Uncharacterized protein n=1 Tax=Acer negundo TaxID=4023 RepID=A0AAD5JHR6_ACENE|nr:hypothetical protein LWI28_014850 [Acer negundo]
MFSSVLLGLRYIRQKERKREKGREKEIVVKPLVVATPLAVATFVAESTALLAESTTLGCRHRFNLPSAATATLFLFPKQVSPQLSSVSLPLDILHNVSNLLSPSTIPCGAPLAHSPNALGIISSSPHLPTDSPGVMLPIVVVLPTMHGSNHPMMTQSKTGTTATKHYTLTPRTRKDALYKHRVNLFLTSSHTPPHTIHDTLLLQSLILLFFSYLSRKLAV